MPIFGRARDPTLWRGRLYRMRPEGYLVQEGDTTSFLRRDQSAVFEDTPFSEPAMWEMWRGEFRRPVQGEVDITPYWRLAPEQKKGPVPKPAGSVPPIITAQYPLTVKVHGVVLMQGSEVSGLGIEEANVEVIAKGDNTITIKGSDYGLGGEDAP